MKIFIAIMMMIFALLGTKEFLNGNYYSFAIDLVWILIYSFWRLDLSLEEIKKGS